MSKQLKVWNGRGDYNKLRGNMNVCSTSQKAAVLLLRKVGLHKMSLRELQTYYSNCWGNAMNGVELEEGVWIVREERGGHSTNIPERLL